MRGYREQLKEYAQFKKRRRFKGKRESVRVPNDKPLLAARLFAPKYIAPWGGESGSTD